MLLSPLLLLLLLPGVAWSLRGVHGGYPTTTCHRPHQRHQVRQRGLEPGQPLWAPQPTLSW